ncbi:MAG: hypothetical protein QOE68_2021, partial [Thermoanaerobaculia bacterium]|nr:hypothetical protein [Thermoanaerobaculia bacterium]
MNALLPLALLQETTTTTGISPLGAGLGMGVVICYLAVILLMIIGMWKVFTKAGKPGWAAIIPIYNIIVALEIAGKPLWWIILMIIPGVNFIVWLLVCLAIAARFGKGTGFG